MRSSEALRLSPRPVGCRVPLAGNQLSRWIYSSKSELTLTRGCAASIRISGPLDEAVLRDSLRYLAQRHESLRTTISVVDGVPEQRIGEALQCDLEVVSLRDVTAADIDRATAQLVQEFVDKKIDLTIGPLFEAKLWQLNQREHVLVLALDHIVSDAISWAILSRELWTLYDQAAQGMAFSLPELPLQFADYVVWQHEVYPAWLAEHGEYWTRRVSGAPSTVVRRDTRGAESNRHISSAVAHFPFGKVLSAGLRELAKREQTSLPFVVLATYVAVVSRWWDQTDMVLALVSHGRQGRPELQNMLGFIAHVLYLRIQILTGESYLALLRRIRSEFCAAAEHRDFGWVPHFIPECVTDLYFDWLPSEWTKRAVDPQRHGRDLRMRNFPVRFAWPEKFVPYFSDSAAGIGVTIVYCPDVVSSDAIDMFGETLRYWAEYFVQRPQESVSIVSMRYELSQSAKMKHRFR